MYELKKAEEYFKELGLSTEQIKSIENAKEKPTIQELGMMIGIGVTLQNLRKNLRELELAGIINKKKR